VWSVNFGKFRDSEVGTSLNKEDGPTVIFVNVPFSVGSVWVVAVTMPKVFRFSDGSEHPEHRIRTPSECVSI
jgi:hypothetical protein